MNREEYLKQKETGHLDMEYMYEYYKAHKKPEWKLISLEEFSTKYIEFLGFPAVIGTNGFPKKINSKNIFKRVCDYFDKIYNYDGRSDKGSDKSG